VIHEAVPDAQQDGTLASAAVAPDGRPSRRGSAIRRPEDPREHDMADDINRLEGRIAELEKEQAALHRQLAQAQIDQWEGRIDDLEVQVHLGSREVADRLDPLVETLRNRWLDAREQMSRSTDTAGDVFATLRSGLEQAMADIRSAVDDARRVATK
jgi:hypothetical protein